MFLIFDTETTGLPRNYNAPVSDSENWPRMVQIAWQLHDELGNLLDARDYIIAPEGYEIPYKAAKVHGITTEKAKADGLPLADVLQRFNEALDKTTFVVGHNVEFDLNIVGAEYFRKSIATQLADKYSIDTMHHSVDFCALPGGKGGGFKYPNLSELHKKLFGEGFDEAHNATADVEATARCFLELLRISIIDADTVRFSPQQVKAFRQANPDVIPPAGVSVKSQVEDYKTLTKGKFHEGKIPTEVIPEVPFNHLHVHTQYSILDGAAKISELIEKASADGMEAIAITDHGNMFGAKDFHSQVKLHNKKITDAFKVDLDKLRNEFGKLRIDFANADSKSKEELKEALKNKEKEIKEHEIYRKRKPLKPIIGCEVYVARRSMHLKEHKEDGGGHQLVLLARNLEGYHNLMKLVSYSYLEGFYYEPRVDKALLKKYHKGIIALSSSLNGEVAQAIMNRGEDEAGKVIEEYRDIFGDDFYLEMVRHPNEHPHTKEVYEDQVFVNSVLKKFSETYRIPLVAANDVHFVDEKDAPAQDRLVCIKSGKYVDEDNRLHYTRQEWFKTQAEMRQLFADLPETLENTSKVADKVADYEIDKKAIMPEFPLPEGFDDHNEYLRHITYEGAKMRWDEITDEISERIDFELETIRNMGFPSYFLIVWDFLKAARELDVSVGPGRGSAAGSAVAYCLRITEIDPIKYDLLFERFLNPERVNMPDIDIDFDDDGRSRILNWVVNKYGEKRVAHIITFGSMAAKSAIRDVARVQRLPLPEADRLARMVPEKPGMTMEKALNSSPELKREMESGTDEVRSVLQYAATLEGSVRNIGTHACGIIIGRDDLENYIPITTAKDSELTYVTQYDGNFVEKVGLLKMDFLGLKTLSIIRDAIANVKLSKGIDVAIDNVPLDDKETFELYSRGETSGLFQFESSGMKKYLKELKPTRFEDLIAMNALYRPGPMEHIPSFIKRKHGEEKIEYDLPEMEEYLKETYGITVYQEQVMHLSRKLAGFSRGQSDSLRKAMGKKKKDLMAGLKVAFVNGCANNGIPKEKIEKIWHDWESFAQYAFNKSHATCYSYVSYQTAYLKAHYPAEYMAAVLSRNMNNIEKVTFFIEECRRMDINVLGPDINESYSRFTVNQKGEIRFGLTAVKGVGQAVVDAIVKERTENGPYQNIFDLVKRSDLKTVNRRSLEALALAGGFDGFKEAHRAQYFVPDEKGGIFLEKIIRYGQQYQQTVNSAQTSLFGDSGDTALPVIRFPETEKWGKLVQLRKERDVIGFYLSGHPLDAFQTEIEHICNATLNDLNKPLSDLVNQNFIVAGIVSKPSPPHLQTRTGKPFGKVTIEDYKGSFEFSVFGDDYARYKGFLETEGVPLLLKLKVVESNYNNGKDEKRHFINIQDIYFLGDALEKMVQKLIINLHLSELTNTMVEDLVTMVNTHPGKGSLQINIQAPEETLYLELYAKDKQVNLSAISKKLKRIEGLTYTLS